MLPSVFILLILLFPIASGQLSSSERRILFRIQHLLEYPPALQGWANWTSFCGLPPSESLTIKCAGNHVTELSVIGNKSSPSSISPKPTEQSFRVSELTLSERFSTDTFFTVVTKLSSLRVLSLVSLGMWGPLPAKIKRLYNLQVLNLRWNFIYGEIPPEIATFQNLHSLVLADNMFKGAVPDFSVLPLQELNVGGNFLGPKFPVLGNKLVALVLKGNLFRSGIPPELRNFDQLQLLDFSNNNILGIIPSTLFSLPSLQYINLAGNGLMGAISKNTSCSSKLRFVDLSENHLVGDLPSCIRYNSSVRTVLYTGNCLSTGDLKYQHPDSFCREKAFAVKPPTEISKKHSNSKLGLVLGVIGAVLGGVILLGLIVLVVGRRVTEKKTPKDPVANKSFNGLSPKLVTNARHGSTAMMFGALGLPQYHVFSLEEIEEATNNFDASNLIGEGSQGQLYKGWLRDGSAAVVRCLKLKQKQSSSSLGRHIEVLSKLRHEHLVSVLGHNLPTTQDNLTASSMYLVFEYVSNGTLRDHLNDPGRSETLKWSQRMAVTIGVARGIQFLHSGVTPGLFGNNLKTENIFLDENLKAKISNYKLPLSHVGGVENKLNGEETHGARGDVYQLGIILLELITGKHITSQSQVDFQRIQLEQGLADTPSELVELVDPSIRDTAAYESLRNTVEVTMNCLSRDSKRRPSIEDVLWNLQYSVQVQEGWTPSGESFGAQSQS